MQWISCSWARGIRCFVTLLFSAFALNASRAASAEDITAGAALYRGGTLPDAVPVEGRRNRLPSLRGSDAACVRCHRRSGLGSAEGRTVIPPITAQFLFAQREESRISPDSQIAPGYHVGRAAYTDATLARAIREGVVPGGGRLDEIMPRYAIDDATMHSLILYLRLLSSAPVPGVTMEAVNFATIVTPDADPIARRGMLDVLTHYAASPNPAFGSPRRMLHPNRRVGYRSGDRRWILHVWELSGRPDSWERQLRRRQAAEPVFAVLSGVGGTDWAPIHHFCQQARLPCILPNIDLPVVAEDDFYPIYFSKGVLLEAGLAARWLTGSTDRRPRRVVQIYRQDDIGRAAAGEIHALLRTSDIGVIDRPLAVGSGPEDWKRALATATPEDVIMLWARPADLSRLPMAPPQVQAVLVSGVMAELTTGAMPAAWRTAVHMTYPQDLPDRSELRTATARSWFNAHQIEIIDERIQLDTYVACSAMSDIVGNLFDTFSRELLIERFEDMIGTSTNPARYPRLGLAQGRRFASKGGYVVHFTALGDPQPIAEGDWIVPQ